MIEDVIRIWIEQQRVSAGDDLTGFVADADYYFGAQPAFLDVRIIRTTDPSSLLNAAITVQPEVASVQQISDAFRAAWLNVAYFDFEATSIRWHQEATVLRFITGSPRSRLGVTGTFIASGVQYPELVATFIREFGPLDSMPGGIPVWAR